MVIKKLSGQAPMAPISCPMTCIEKIGDEEGDGEGGMGYKPYKLVVQTIVMPHREILSRIFRRGWATTEDGNPFIVTPSTTRFVNPTMLFPWSNWPRRSTLVQLPDLTWQVVEHCVAYFTKLNYEEIPECDGKPCFTITMLHKKDEPIASFGFLHGQEEVQGDAMEADAESFAFQPDPLVPQEL